jgi:hypothetical protein
MFVGLARAYQSEAPFRFSTLGYYANLYYKNLMDL